MNIERTMEFILKQQAKFESNFAKAEKRLDRLERVVGQLASASLRFRNEIRRSQIEADRQLKALRELSHGTAEKLDETADKLNTLIGVVDKFIRRNGKGAGPD